jgi:hypothetical protein
MEANMDVAGTTGSSPSSGPKLESLYPPDEPPLDPMYLNLFLLKYVCSQPSCYGTMAPVTAGANIMECNVCTQTRPDEHFIADLEGK